MSNSEQSYTPVNEKEDLEDLPFNRHEHYASKKRSRTYHVAIFLLRFVCLILLAGFVFEFWGIFSNIQSSLDDIETSMESHQPETSHDQPIMGATPHMVKQCMNPKKRPAWHELSVSEKMEYIRAVNCLPTKPSYIHPNSTVYDDFTWMHIVDGDQSTFLVDEGTEEC